jgi:hypothetical protein
MQGFDLDKYMESYRKIEDSLSSTVKISQTEVCILVVKDLIAKRNGCKDDRQKAFDVVIRWYIDEDEFQKFVINREPVI